MAMTKKEQLELKVAKMRLAEAEEKIKVLFGDKLTNLFMVDFPKEYPLLPHADIKFVLPGVGNVIRARIRNGWLEIMGDSRIKILPQASNVIQISIEG